MKLIDFYTNVCGENLTTNSISNSYQSLNFLISWRDPFKFVISTNSIISCTYNNNDIYITFHQQLHKLYTFHVDTIRKQYSRCKDLEKQASLRTDYNTVTDNNHYKINSTSNQIIYEQFIYVHVCNLRSFEHFSL